MKKEDLDNMVAMILEMREKEGMGVIAEDAEEDEEEKQVDPEVAEVEANLLKAQEEVKEGGEGAQKQPGEGIDTKVEQQEEEDEDEGVTMRLPPKKTAAQVQAQKVPEPVKQEEEDEPEEATQKTPGVKQAIKEEVKQEESSEEETTQVLPKKGQAAEPPKLHLAMPANMKVAQKDIAKKAEVVVQKQVKIEMKVRTANNLSDITLDPSREDEHELFLYKENRFIHAQTYLDYKDEAEYINDRRLLVKRACQKQTIHKTDMEKFEAQDTEVKVTNFLQKYSRYFKDVVNIKQLAKGGEAIVYILEHSLPDELVIKCPILTEEQQNLKLATAFNGILYESQTINLNPHQGHVVNNVEEIILYNEKKGVITNYCVIVEKAKYTLENVIKYWAGKKYNDKLKKNEVNWHHENQDFYTPEKVSFYFFQTLMAVSYFHKHNIYYGDMKGANLLIFRNQEVKIGDLGISIKLNPNKENDQTKYIVKGTSAGYCLPEITKAWMGGESVSRELLLKNDKYAIKQTFMKAIAGIYLIPGVKDKVIKDNPYFARMAKDVGDDSKSLEQIVKEWAVILDSDTQFKNKLCEQLKIEYKFLGLPKVHLMLDQELMQNFYMKKQIVYKREVPEDDLKDPGSDFFIVHPSGRSRTFPYARQGKENDPQSIKEKIDLFWSLKAAKSTRKEIKAEHENILEEQLGLTKKRINNQMHDFKDFEIKKALEPEKKAQSLVQILTLDAISGPNNEGYQIELQHKLCFEIAKGLRKEHLSMYFLRRVEQIFILEYEEKDKESSFKEQHVKRLKQQIEQNHKLYESDVQFKHTIQFAFYSYYMYKDLHAKNQDLPKQIDHLEKARDIFKNLMGENIELQNQIIHKKAIAHQKLGLQLNEQAKVEEAKGKVAEAWNLYKGSLDNFKAATSDFKRLYLTNKSLESFHDYIYSFRMLLKLAKEQDGDKIVNAKTDEEVMQEVRFIYDLQSGFLLFKEFFNEYYQFVPGYGIENKKIRDRLWYVKELDIEEKDPELLLKHFKSFLKQINDNSTEDVSKRRTHLHSYDYMLPKNTFLKLKYRQFDMETIDLSKSILSDDIEFLLNQQRDKIILKRLTVHFDINQNVICIDSRYLNTRTGKVYDTDHYKELKQYEVVLDIPDFVYPIAINIIDTNPIIEKADQNKKDTGSKDEEEEQSLVKWVIIQLSNFSIFKLSVEKGLEQMDLFDKDFENRIEIKNGKTLVFFNRLTKPLNDYILGTFQHFNPVNNQLAIQNYFFKMDKRQYIISLMRSCFAKLQIVQTPQEIDYDKENSLILYKNQYLFSHELLKNPIIRRDLEKGDFSFNWLFGQEKMLLQRKADFKQYLKDVRNHFIYYMKNFYGDGELETYTNEQEKEAEENNIEKLRVQMGQTIDVFRCFDEAITKMFNNINQRYLFKVDADSGEEKSGRITLGYQIGDKHSDFGEVTSLDVLEQKIYLFELMTLVNFAEEQGHHISSIEKITMGQDTFRAELRYAEKGESFKELFQKYLESKQSLKGAMKQEVLDLLERPVKDLLVQLTWEFATKLKDNLNDVSKKDKVFLHLMRVTPSPFKHLYQSELYCYTTLPEIGTIKGTQEESKSVTEEESKSGAEETKNILEKLAKHQYTEEEKVLLVLMILKCQHKANTPINTIRKLKYTTQYLFTPELIGKVEADLRKLSDEDKSKDALLSFYMEQLFIYHATDTTPELLQQFKATLASKYEPDEFIEYGNLFFHGSYNYYSQTLDVLLRQLSDYFSLMQLEDIRTCISTMGQIVLARFQGDMKANKEKYYEFLKQYYQDAEDKWTEQKNKLDEFIDKEYEDGDYKKYYTEYKEYSQCGEAIDKIKEVMPKARKSPNRVPQPEDLEKEYQAITTAKLNEVEKLIQQVTMASKFSRFRNMIVVALTQNIHNQALQQSVEKYQGNLALRKLILKVCGLKHRIFNQFRVLKKYLPTLEELVHNRVQSQGVVSAYSPEQIKEMDAVIDKSIEEIWKQYDEDNSGFLDKEETRVFVLKALTEIGESSNFKEEDFGNCFNEFADNESYQIGRENLKAFIKEVASQQLQQASNELTVGVNKMLNKTVVATLVEQYDHHYLPKWKEVFNRLDEWHRFTNFDDLELLVIKQAQHERKHSLEESKSELHSKYFSNKFIDIQDFTYLKTFKVFVDQYGSIHHIGAHYTYNGEDILGEGFDGKGLDNFKAIQVDLADDESIDDISGTQDAKSLAITLAKGGVVTHKLTFTETLEQVKTPVENGGHSRRVIAFSGLKSKHGLLNFNLYFYHCEQSPEEPHLYIAQDSDEEDYFNDN